MVNENKKIGEEVPDLNIAEAIHDLQDSQMIVWNKEKTKIGLKYSSETRKTINF